MNRQTLHRPIPTRRAGCLMLCLFWFFSFSVNASERPSVIRLPVSIPLSNLAALMTSEMDKEHQWTTNNAPCTRGWRLPFLNVPIIPRVECRATVLLTISDFPVLSTKNDALHISIPVNAVVAIRGQGLFGKLMSLDSTLQAQLDVELRPSIHPDWTFRSGLVLSHSWLSKPVVKLGDLFAVSVAPYLDTFINEQRDVIAELTDRELNAAGLQKMLHVGWQQIQQPLTIASEPSMYLHAVPQTLTLGPIAADQQRLSLSAQIGAYLSISAEARTNIAPAELPTPEMVEKIDTQTELNVRVHVPLAALSAEISKLLELPRTEPMSVGDQMIAQYVAQAIDLRSGPGAALTGELNGYLEFGQSARESVALSVSLRPQVHQDTRRVTASDISARLAVGSNAENDALFQLLFGNLEQLIARYEGLSYERLLGKSVTDLLTAELHVIDLSDNALLSIVPGEWSIAAISADDDQLSLDVGLSGELSLEVKP